MPELPEVETTRRGIETHIINQKISDVIVRDWQLRYPIPKTIKAKLKDKVIVAVERRAKYILIFISAQNKQLDESDEGLLIHLGMSGSLRVIIDAANNADREAKKHDHVDFVLNNKKILRYHDPRKFGLILWEKNLSQHKLLSTLGPEPFEDVFDGKYLRAKAQKKTIAVKPFIMDQKTVVGVGNIYAAEALFMSGINPKRSASKISVQRYEVLSENIKKILAHAIKQGGTTLKDFVNGDGKPGYFQQQLLVYGRGGEPCVKCEKPLKEIKLGQRASVYCGYCQK